MPILCSVSINWAIFEWKTRKKRSVSHVYWLHVAALNCCKLNKQCVVVDTGCRATISGKSHLPLTPTGGAVDTCNCIPTYSAPEREKTTLSLWYFTRFLCSEQWQALFHCKTDGERGVYRVGESEGDIVMNRTYELESPQDMGVDLCFNSYGLIL